MTAEVAGLEPLVGEWSVEAIAPWAPSDLRGKTVFDWMTGGQFLLQRWEVPVPEAPDGLAVIGLDGSGPGYLQHYFDSRGVARVYAMSFDDGVWTLSRTTADFSPLDFSQRFTGAFSDDGRTIRGRWELAHDGSTWEHDFDLVYTRVGNNDRMTILQGEFVRLRPAALDDVPELARIRATPEVHRHWRGGDDMVAAVMQDFAEPDSTAYAIELEGRIVGWIQWQAEDETEYRHASIDIYVDPAVHGRGVGTDAVRTLARHLIDDHGHHRLTIDPAADNPAAIRAYTKVGFRPVGVQRRAERGSDGTWHDSLLMDLLAEELGEENPDPF